MKVFSVKIDLSIDRARFMKLLFYLGSDTRQRLEKIRLWPAKIRGLTAELLIRKAIVDQTGLDNNKIKISRDEWGKPFLNHHPEFHFNLSHSGEWIAGILNHSMVGIDIQKIKKVDLSLAERFFSLAEFKFWQSQPVENRIRSFFIIWTLKESYLKAIGKGMRIPLTSFTVNQVNQNDGTYNLKTAQGNRFYLKNYTFDKDYELSVCGVDKNFSAEVEKWKMDDLIRFFDI